MFEFQTNTLKTRKKVLIDGVEYTVRRFGNIEQLEQNKLMRQLSAFAAKEQKAPLTDEETEEVDSISLAMSSMFIALFDDGGDQSKSKALIASLSDVEFGMLLTEIYTDKTTDETS